MRLYDSHASKRATPTAASSGSEPEFGQKAAAKTISGQCHKYQL